jgi:hypothetical protein
MKVMVVLGLSLLTTLQTLGFGQEHAEEIPPGFGAVEGKVIDATGNPVAHAKVYAILMNRPTGRLHFTHSDKDGKFFLGAVLAGTNEVFASKEAAAYPDSFSAFYPQGPHPPKVSVETGVVTRGVVVRLGVKGGTLLGRVLDARNKQPVINASIILAWRDDPRRYMSIGPESPNGTFHVLVPPVPIKFTMRVSAPGYQDWSFGGPISIGSEQSKEIIVLLYPVEKP